jgi:hypothetical protein
MCQLQDVNQSGLEATLLVGPVEGPHGTLDRIAMAIRTASGIS